MILVLVGVIVGALLPVAFAVIDDAIDRRRRRAIERRRLIFGQQVATGSDA
jgi:hypothetical protein